MYKCETYKGFVIETVTTKKEIKSILKDILDCPIYFNENLDSDTSIYIEYKDGSNVYLDCENTVDELKKVSFVNMVYVEINNSETFCVYGDTSDLKRRCDEWSDDNEEITENEPQDENNIMANNEITIYNPTTKQHVTRNFSKPELHECVRDGFTIAIKKVNNLEVAIFEMSKRFFPTGKSVDFNYYGSCGVMKFDSTEKALEFLKGNDMSEMLYNIHDETAEVVELPAGTIVKFEDGITKIFLSYEKAIKRLFRMGYHY